MEELHFVIKECEFEFRSLALVWPFIAISAVFMWKLENEKITLELNIKDDIKRQQAIDEFKALEKIKLNPKAFYAYAKKFSKQQVWGGEYPITYFISGDLSNLIEREKTFSEGTLKTGADIKKLLNVVCLKLHNYAIKYMGTSCELKFSYKPFEKVCLNGNVKNISKSILPRCWFDWNFNLKS